MRHWGRRVHPESQGSLRCLLGFDGFVRGRWVHRGTPRGSSGFSWVAGFIRMHREERSSSGDAGFIGVRTGGRRVRAGSLGLLRYSKWFVGFIRGSWVHYNAPFVS